MQFDKYTQTHTHTHTQVEIRGRTQEDGNRDGSGYGNESSSEDGNGDEDGNRDENENGIGEGGGEAKKTKKSHKNCRRYQALLFRKLHHLCRQEVALAGTRQLRSRGLVPGHAHHAEGLTGSGRREGSNKIGSGIGVVGRNRNRNEVGGRERRQG